jgi:hypothetical protein
MVTVKELFMIKFVIALHHEGICSSLCHPPQLRILISSLLHDVRRVFMQRLSVVILYATFGSYISAQDKCPDAVACFASLRA